MRYILAVMAFLTIGTASAQKPGSKVYIPPAEPEKTLEDGTKMATTSGGTFDQTLQAEFMKEGVPITLTVDRNEADYKMNWGLAPETHYGNFEVYTATASLVDKTNQVIWSGVVTKRTQAACADALAKLLKNAMKHKK
jgi:hypothetical protein